LVASANSGQLQATVRTPGQHSPNAVTEA